VKALIVVPPEKMIGIEGVDLDSLAVLRVHDKFAIVESRGASPRYPPIVRSTEVVFTRSVVTIRILPGRQVAHRGIVVIGRLIETHPPSPPVSRYERFLARHYEEVLGIPQVVRRGVERMAYETIVLGMPARPPVPREENPIVQARDVNGVRAVWSHRGG
jgi:hypothetical protein